ncbi:MAG TPA: hypothetical protein VFV87_02695 [Pirellulaceae bacterium]|nr:hypothetical protein [Pirellulaceae bacterium]
MNEVSRRSQMALSAVGLLLAANVVVPLLWGDVYPFTSAPMFRDAPARCCNYRVFASNGSELPAEDWLVQRIYDGNPVGYGVGICPPEILERFGEECDEATVRRHIARQFAQPQNCDFEYVEVVQELIGPVDAQQVGVVRSDRWRVDRP